MTPVCGPALMGRAMGALVLLVLVRVPRHGRHGAVGVASWAPWCCSDSRRYHIVGALVLLLAGLSEASAILAA